MGKGKNAGRNAKPYNVKARAKYDADKYDKILIRVKKGVKEEWQAAAGEKSLNAFIVDAVEEIRRT